MKNNRTLVSIGNDEQKALESLEKTFPEWKYKATPDKVKEMFWLGIRSAEKRRNAVYTTSSRDSSLVSDFGFKIPINSGNISG